MMWSGYDSLRKHKIEDGIRDYWGYSAFDGVDHKVFAQAMETQIALLGSLTYSEVLEDRCTVVLEGTAPGSSGDGKGVYVTLSWLNGFEKGLRRETIVAPHLLGGVEVVVGRMVLGAELTLGARPSVQVLVGAVAF